MSFHYLLEDGSGALLLESSSALFLFYLLLENALPPPPPNLQPSIISDGQQLTPYQNVNAPAGMGGDVWGANGGGITPIFGPLPILANASRAVSQTNEVYDAKNSATVQGGLSRGAVSTRTADQVYADDSTQTVWTADLESPNVATSQL